MYEFYLKVIESNILKTMSKEQIAYKEALFEIITSQASFVRFVKCHALSGQPDLGSCIDMHEFKQLFSNLITIKDVNEK